MIDERMEEQASLHVLGLLTGTEQLEFTRALQSDPELQALVARLSTATGALAGAVPLVEPPPQLRAKMLAQVTPPQKTVSLPEPKFRVARWLPWAFATSLAVVCAGLFLQDSQLRKTVGDQARQIGTLNQLALSLEASTNSLRQAVLALQETNRMANLRIAMLNSLAADAPNSVAVTLWDNKRQDGIFVAQNLKTLPTDRDYELWVIDENQKPVAAGVFQVAANGSVRMEFKPAQLIKTAGVFAVTEEIKGGVASPTVKNMVLASSATR